MANEYIPNAKLEESIAKFKDAKKKRNLDPDSEATQLEFNETQDELAQLFYLLSENIIRAFNFKLIDKEDALQEGVMICLEKVDRFDPTYIGMSGKPTKAFNYMTTCVLNHFRQLYRGAKNQQDLQKKYFDHLIETVEKVFLRQSSKGHMSNGTRNVPPEEN